MLLSSDATIVSSTVGTPISVVTVVGSSSAELSAGSVPMDWSSGTVVLVSSEPWFVVASIVPAVEKYSSLRLV